LSRQAVDVLARQGRHVDGARNLLEQVGVLPGDHVLQPGHLIGLQGLAEADTAIDVQMPEVIGRQRDLVADLFRTWAT
jgi:hypothetical protein